MSNGPLLRPADGNIHSEAGPRWGRTHAGVDLSEWDWRVRSMYRGTVVSVVYHAVSDWRVNVRHNGFITRYIHLRSVSVKVGDKITGDTPAARVIGRVGTAGTGPHVHVEIHPGSVWRGTASASVARINALLLGTRADGSSNPTIAATTASSITPTTPTGGLTVSEANRIRNELSALIRERGDRNRDQLAALIRERTDRNRQQLAALIRSETDRNHEQLAKLLEDQEG